MNCFTVEASFFGYMSRDRESFQFTSPMLENMGKALGEAVYDYVIMLEEDYARVMRNRD